MLILIGPLPPPVHGAAAVTLEVVKLLEARSIPHRTHSTAPKEGTSGIRYHVSRIGAVARAFLAVFFCGSRRATVYLSISGGLGLAYDFVLALGARLRGFDVIVHHHSFAYLDRRSKWLALLVIVAGQSQTHIVLCGRMAGLLANVYPKAKNIEIVSNGAFWAENRPAAKNNGPFRAIGFLANITLDKGIDRFLDLIEELRAEGWPNEAIIAGPIEDEGLRALVLERATAIGNIRYLGPVYGEARTNFLSQIDLMVFPTRYANEAEPLVVLEAQRVGIPVAASNRGCIGEMIEPGDGLLLDSQGSYPPLLVERILEWTADVGSLRATRHRLEESADLRARSNAAAYDRLFNILKNERASVHER